jgi:hypothetical protein
MYSDGPSDIIFTMCGKVFHVVGYVTQVQYRYDSPIELYGMGGRHSIFPGQNNCQIKLEIAGTGVDVSEGKMLPIGRRLVRECTIDELLFAVQHKIKDEKLPG